MVFEHEAEYFDIKVINEFQSVFEQLDEKHGNQNGNKYGQYCYFIGEVVCKRYNCGGNVDKFSEKFAFEVWGSHRLCEKNLSQRRRGRKETSKGIVIFYYFSFF